MPAVLMILGLVVTVLPLVLWALRRASTGAWVFDVSDFSWKKAVGVLLLCGSAAGFLFGASSAISQSDRWAAQQQTVIAGESAPSADAALQVYYGLLMEAVDGFELTPTVSRPETEVIVRSSELAGAQCLLKVNPGTSEETLDVLSSSQDFSILSLSCAGVEVYPEDHNLPGVTYEEELRSLSEESYNGALIFMVALSTLMGLGVSGLVIFVFVTVGRRYGGDFGESITLTRAEIDDDSGTSKDRLIRWMGVSVVLVLLGSGAGFFYTKYASSLPQFMHLVTVTDKSIADFYEHYEDAGIVFMPKQPGVVNKEKAEIATTESFIYSVQGVDAKGQECRGGTVDGMQRLVLTCGDNENVLQ